MQPPDSEDPIQPTLRSGGFGDLDELERLWLQVHQTHRSAMPDLAPYVDDASSWSARRALYERLLADGAFLVVAESSAATLVGYGLACVHPVEATWLHDTRSTGARIGEIESLAVDAGHRRAGLGHRLLEALVTRLRYHGVEDLILGAVDGNRDTIRCYERLGFRPTWLYLSRLSGRDRAAPSRTERPRPPDTRRER